jgi:hypothetical protein
MINSFGILRRGAVNAVAVIQVTESLLVFVILNEGAVMSAAGTWI